MQVVFALITAAGGLGQMAPSFTALTSARAATARIHAIIDCIPVIDTAVEASEPVVVPLNASPASSSPSAERGRIEFPDVTFAYPYRPEVNVLKNFSLVIEPGQHFALVGPSGCGKSTLIALIQRWYDVQGGAVLVDGVDVRAVGVQALHGCQALVSQESFFARWECCQELVFGGSGVRGGGGGTRA
jgi:ATP-binding cassette subfamily B (MDR/TAP) protein 1